MKRKTSLLIIVLLILALICTPGYGYESVLIKADDNGNFVSQNTISAPIETDLNNFLTANNIRTVEDYAHWLNQNMQYQENPDSTDWFSWQKTLNRHTGDCKNLSALTARVLKWLGYDPVLIGYRKKLEGHLFTTFMKDGKINIFDNTKYYETKATTLDEIGVFLYKNYDIEVMFKINLDPQISFHLLYTRDKLAQIARDVQPI